MIFLNFLFKSYFSIFYNKGDKGIAASIFSLSVPLGLINFTLIFFLLSLIIKINEIGSFFFGLICAGTVFLTGMLLRRRYRNNYDFISTIQFGSWRVFYIITAILFYFCSLFFFLIITVSLYS
jgi:hypothetical protein